MQPKEMPSTRILIFYLTVIIYYSCSVKPAEFGITIIAKQCGTHELKNAVSEIRSVKNDVYEAHSFRGNEEIPIKYRLLRPAQVLPRGKSYPLVIVFHGSN